MPPRITRAPHRDAPHPHITNPHIVYTAVVAHRAGFTVLELMIAAAIGATLLLAGALLLTSGTRSSTTTSDTVRASATLTTATRLLHEDLRTARSITSALTSTASGCSTITTNAGPVTYCNTPDGATRDTGGGEAPFTRPGGHVLIDRVGNQYRVTILPAPHETASTFTVTSRLEAHRE